MASKRLFFALKVTSDWPKKLPEGRLIAEEDRHLTLAFLGNVPFEPLETTLNELPLPSFKAGSIGYFDKSLFLPKSKPRVAAWHVDLVEQAVAEYQSQLVVFLREKGYAIEERSFLPHVTLARAPFSFKEWEEAFVSMPCIATSLNLYESVGNLRYKPIWQHFLKE